MAKRDCINTAKTGDVIINGSDRPREILRTESGHHLIIELMVSALIGGSPVKKVIEVDRWRADKAIATSHKTGNTWCRYTGSGDSYP